MQFLEICVIVRLRKAVLRHGLHPSWLPLAFTPAEKNRKIQKQLLANKRKDAYPKLDPVLELLTESNYITTFQSDTVLDGRKLILFIFIVLKLLSGQIGFSPSLHLLLRYGRILS